MEAFVLAGKDKGSIVQVSDGFYFGFKREGIDKVYHPISLAFKTPDFNNIHPSMFVHFESKPSPSWANEFMWTFRKIKERTKKL